MSVFRDLPFSRWLTPSMAVLVASNLMVLYGLFYLGWGVFALIFLFWLENVIIGLFNVLKMLANRPSETANWFGKLFMIPFFSVHYGMFTGVHGIFVLSLFGPESLKQSIGSPFEAGAYLQVIETEHLGYMLFALLFSHGFSFVANYVLREEYEQQTLKEVMSAPYGRVVVLHLTILSGGFLLVALGSPFYGRVILLGLKIVFDAWAHYREHRRKDASAEDAEGKVTSASPGR
jgi:hypothetical protein